MAYQTLYLRWRPSSFDMLVGQAPVKQALMNALSSGRIAHAYLFTGPRGTGKTTTARIFAKALNCKDGPTDHPCGECLNCRQITDGGSLDVQELDAASNRGVDDIKNLNKNADFAPVNCRYKVYIIDEAHMLTTEACNALLKTLEEPPEHVVFILATTEPQKILPTIHSRCQRFDFHPITQEEIVAHLQKVATGSDIKAEKEALELIAAASEGGMRDALSLLEQCGVMAETVTTETVRSVRGIIGREILRELVRAVGRREIAAALTIFDRLLVQGKDISQVLIELSGYMRALLLYKATPEYQPIYVTDTAEELAKLAELYSGERILAAQEIIHQAMNELRFTTRGRVTAEMSLYDLCCEDNRTLKAMAARISRLEQELAQLKESGVTASFCVKTDKEIIEKRSVASADPEMGSLLTQQNPAVTEAVPDPVVVAAEAIPDPAVAETMSRQEEGNEEKAGSGRSAKPVTLTEQVDDKAERDVVSEKTDEPVPTASIQNYTPYGGAWAEGDEYWSQAMEILKAERKNSIASCASHGSVVAYENKVLIVGFKMKFLCERLQKADYREVVEEILLRVAREPVRLQCVVDTTAAGSSDRNLTGHMTGMQSETQEVSLKGSGKKDSGQAPINTGSAKKEALRMPAAEETAEGASDIPVSESTKKAMEMFKATLHKV